MYRFLLSRRWVITTLLALLLVPVMIRLGFWQLHRHEARVARNTLIADNLAAKPVPIGSLTSPGFQVPGDLTWRTVSASGHYDPAHEFVVRQRTDSGGDRIGYFVITPLVTDDGDTVLVNRGWVDSGDDATAYPKVPAAPSGEVTVTGRLRADETSRSSGIRERGGLPDRQYMLINSGQQADRLSGPVLGGYIELASTAPEPRVHAQQLPQPDHSDIGPHMAYAVQWWLFTAMVPVGWVVLVRREAKDLRAQRTAEQAEAAGGEPEPSPAPAAVAGQ
ncbi:SURF1 family cytochrome oxidase biogenesis protein [Peterkaempfera bronchialis]|uniref:SURF1-like protein n=1 Tax=Peterkaempfera bronchialis TaxID=2126346 RepID=A0A345T230_9ACTN|nr:SURF1 family protein [Peterkaempfera bronchialis]AXI80035.1 SURF1 family protein [Peterkaempfera bronchialis]